MPVSRFASTLAVAASLLAPTIVQSAPPVSLPPTAPRTDIGADPATRAIVDFPAAASTITQSSMPDVPVRFHISGPDAITSINVVVCGDPGAGTCSGSYLASSNYIVPAAGPYEVSWSAPNAGFDTGERAINILVQIELKLADGTSSWSPPAHFTYVLNPRASVALRFPLDGATLTAPATAVLWGTASFVPGSGISPQRVDFYDGMDLLGSVAESNVTPAGYALRWSDVPIGPHEIWMRVIDSQGHDLETDPATLYVLPPPAPMTVTLASPITGDTFGYGSVVPLRAAATIAEGRIERVEYVDGTDIIATATVPPYEASWTLATDGMHAISARAYDELGNATASRAAYVRVAGSARSPRVMVKSPIDQSVYALGTPVTAELAMDAPDAPIASVQFDIDGESSLVASPPFTLRFASSWTGKHSVHAVARDALNRLANSDTVHFFVTPDGSPPVGEQPTGPPPTVALTAPADQASVVLGNSVDVAASADGHGHSILRVDFSVNGAVVGSTSQRPYHYSWTPSSAGVFRLTATAVSNNGRSAISSPVSVNVTQPASWASVAPIAPGAVFYAGDTVTFQPAELHVTGFARVEYFVDGTSVGLVGAPYLMEWDAPGPGTYSISIRIHDDMGTSAASAAVPLTVKPVTIRITSPLDGAAIDGRSTFVEGSFEGPVNVGIRVNGVLATRDRSGHFFLNAIPLGDGSTPISAEISGAAGNRVSTSITVQMASTVDDDTPEIVDVVSEGIDTLTMPLMVANPDSVASWRLLDSRGTQMAQGSTTADGVLTTASFPAPGVYRQKLEVTDRKGRVILRSVNAQVTSLADLRSEQVAVINRFFDALSKQRKDRALSTLTGGMALVFGQVYDALSDHWPEIVQSISAVGATSHGLNEFEGAAIRDRDGKRYVYLIEGIKDDDGVWRIDSF